MDKDNKKQYKCILLQTMKDFIKLCEENNIKYVAAFGTVLGAIRHKGLIPWDDDIDVYMLRKDYERFLKLKSTIIKSNYEIIDYTNSGYYLPYAKFCNKNTTLWEVEELPFIIGVFIDIFPIDEIDTNIENIKIIKMQYQKSWLKYFSSIFKPSKKQLWNYLIQFRIHHFLSYLRNRIYAKFFTKSFFNYFTKNEGFIKNIKGENYIFYDLITQDISIKKLIYPKKWINNTIEVPFEDFKINIPYDYHEYLTNEYGDYMLLPPEEKRVSQHSHFYLNLNKRIYIKEISLQ